MGSILEAKCLGYLDGIAILVAVLVVVFVGAAQEAAKQVSTSGKLSRNLSRAHTLHVTDHGHPQMNTTRDQIMTSGVCDQPRDQISSRVGHFSNVD